MMIGFSVAIAVVLVFGATVPNVIVVLAIAPSPAATRVARSSALTLKNLMFVEAARALEVRTKTSVGESDYGGDTEVVRINDPLCPSTMALHLAVGMPAREKSAGR